MTSAPLRRLTLPLLIVLLNACAAPQAQQQIAAPGKTPHFFKDGVSDRQMTRDLNACAMEVFRQSLDSATAATGDEAVRKQCMREKGYEIYYNN